MTYVRYPDFDPPTAVLHRTWVVLIVNLIEKNSTHKTDSSEVLNAWLTGSWTTWVSMVY